jgi:hypothetical protein
MILSLNCRRSALRCTLAGAALALQLALGGCYSEGGPGWSEDQFVYISRPHQPLTVTLKDTRTGQDFWTAQVPVGKQLVVHFVRGEGTGDTFTPDRMEWAIMNDGAEWDRLGNNMPVPPANSRRLDAIVRTSPEIPERMTQATTPSGGESSPNRGNP